MHRPAMALYGGYLGWEPWQKMASGKCGVCTASDGTYIPPKLGIAFVTVRILWKAAAGILVKKVPMPIADIFWFARAKAPKRRRHEGKEKTCSEHPKIES